MAAEDRPLVKSSEESEDTPKDPSFRLTEAISRVNEAISIKETSQALKTETSESTETTETPNPAAEILMGAGPEIMGLLASNNSLVSNSLVSNSLASNSLPSNSLPSNSLASNSSIPKIPRKWTLVEDEELRHAVRKYGESNWKDIAREVGTRNHVQCLQRWKKVLKPGLVKGQWSALEDAKLVDLVGKGFKNWGQLAAQMPGRTSKQCRERWSHHLDPSVKKGEYTTEEDNTILRLQSELGNKWSEIAKHLPGRTENAVKIRWKALDRLRQNAGSGRGQAQIRSRNHPDSHLKVLAAQAAVAAIAKAQLHCGQEGGLPAGYPRDPDLVTKIHEEHEQRKLLMHQQLDVETRDSKRRRMPLPAGASHMLGGGANGLGGIQGGAAAAAGLAGLQQSLLPMGSAGLQQMQQMQQMQLLSQVHNLPGFGSMHSLQEALYPLGDRAHLMGMGGSSFGAAVSAAAGKSMGSSATTNTRASSSLGQGIAQDLLGPRQSMLMDRHGLQGMQQAAAGHPMVLPPGTMPPMFHPAYIIQPDLMRPQGFPTMPPPHVASIPSSLLSQQLPVSTTLPMQSSLQISPPSTSSSQSSLLSTQQQVNLI